MSDLLKGNYKVPEPNMGKPAESTDPLEKQFEAEALKKLGGSITFVKKKGSFIWRGKKELNDKKEGKNE